MAADGQLPLSAGTRGPLDTVEIPSHTMELFASDPRVLALFAQHHRTGEPLPRPVIDAVGCLGLGNDSVDACLAPGWHIMAYAWTAPGGLPLVVRWLGGVYNCASSAAFPQSLSQ